MARIVPKLNLNKTPELVDNNSLIFAKNIRLNANGLSSDYGFDRVDQWKRKVGNRIITVNAIKDNEKVVGIIPYNTCVYVLVHSDEYQDEANNTIPAYSAILKYDESTGQWSECPCNWNWSGGKIDGYCTINLNGDTILSIAESFDNPETLVPLKHIVLPIASIEDDETLYTQSPNVPLINLKCVEKYKNTIPAGTYQFFIRYEIRRNHYTNWFPASKELFAGTARTLLTNQGRVNYIDNTVDSNESFKLQVETIKEGVGFKSFQLGFILAHDDEVYARAYKHYELDSTYIYFDYDTEYIEEIDVKEITESVYSLYNVKNITSYRNKLYISNYIESDFNPNISNYAKNVSIEFKTAANESITKFAGYNFTSALHDGTSYIESLDITGPFNTVTKTIPEIVDIILQGMKLWITDADTGNRTVTKYGLIAEITKYTPELFTPVDEGDIIVVDDDPVDAANRDKTYYLKNNTINGFSYNSKNIDDVFSALSNHILGIKMDGTVVSIDWLNNEQYLITYNTYTKRGGTYYKRTTEVSIIFKANAKDIQNDYILDSSYSLVPHQKYAFYLHFVRPNGEITNGCRIPDVLDDGTSNITGQVYPDFTVQEAIDTTNDNNCSAIYPAFTFNFNIPSEYVACFISMVHIENNIAQIFDIKTREISSNTITYGDCLELDARLYPALKDIEVLYKDNDVLSGSFVDYHASYDNDFLATFGTSGKCVFRPKFVLGDTSYAFIRLPYNANEKYIQLTRCTPFITFNDDEPFTYDDYDSLNLLGYVCRVSKPNDNFDTYYSGRDIYDVTRRYTKLDGYALSLIPHSDTGDKWKLYNDSGIFTIYSNFNLNYIGVRETVSRNIVTKTHQVEGSSTSSTESYLLLTFESLQLSEVYELQSMYRSYTKRLYYPYDDYNTNIKFDNTIRSSELHGDEEVIDMFRFKATDYYNVPTDKGIIVNLVAIADNILVHTQDSMYKFSGQNSLTAAGGEDVQLKESEVFDTGIQELFGSEFGYAGLASKEHQILSEFGYTFWDRDSGRIYLYTGNAQMKVLSDDITKLLRRANVTNIHLADDYYNNRIFICVEFSDNKVTTLSYDFVAKSFISVHDFAFNWHFKTKTRCYFIYNNHDIYKVGTAIGSYGPFLITDNDVYPKHNIEDCVVDVIFNDNFEVIKTLNTIEWICNKIMGFDTEINMAEETFSVTDIENRYKGDYLRLYSDSCMTDELDIRTRSNDERLRNTLEPFNFKPAVDSYKQVRYNLGKWTFNYFRNILNRNQNPTSPRTLTRDDTLIYGKYFVARFVFDRTVDFKFEDVTFNISTDYNV